MKKILLFFAFLSLVQYVDAQTVEPEYVGRAFLQTGNDEIIDLLLERPS